LSGLFFCKEVGGLAKKYKYLTLEDRRKLARLYRRGDTVASIAEELGVSPGTVYKDLHRGDTGETDKNWRNEYDPVLADKVFRRTMSERGRKNASSGVVYPRAVRRDC
jgi:IS30 family transposase